jgi:hypothetical protein
VKRDDSDSSPTTPSAYPTAPPATAGSQWVSATPPGAADETLVVEEPALVPPEPYATSGSGRPGGDRL